MNHELELILTEVILLLLFAAASYAILILIVAMLRPKVDKCKSEIRDAIASLILFTAGASILAALTAIAIKFGRLYPDYSLCSIGMVAAFLLGGRVFNKVE